MRRKRKRIIYSAYSAFAVPSRFCLTGTHIFSTSLKVDVLGPIYTVRFLSHATILRQTYSMTHDCSSVLKHVLKCYDIFSDVHDNRKSCRGPIVSLSHATKIVPCKSVLKLALKVAPMQELILNIAGRGGSRQVYAVVRQTVIKCRNDLKEDYMVNNNL